ncbi:integrase core domain-containing protein [Kitasatospora sp. NPDC002227]|uniref:integrase core domain-containing protein n=1 Tax=Kitasatospora sp. NPDC002227 TaxID=3154773 RepID=UPI00331BB203
MIRTEAGMPTARFCRLIGVPERTWRRHQARARQGAQARGPWPRPARESVRETARRHALAHPAWGHRKVWAMCRHDGHRVSQATVLRLLRDEGLLLEANYQRERRQLAARRKAAFATGPTGPNQVWQLDFSEFETASGGTWRLAGCRDYWSKYELGWHVSPTANQHDAIAAIELALKEAESLAGMPLAELAPRDADGTVKPLVTIVTDNGGPFRSFRFEAFIATRPELRHVRTRVRTPGQNGSRERGFGSLKYEKLFLEEIPDALDLVRHAEDYRRDYNTVRPHEALAWNRPHDVHTGAADPLVPNFPEPENLPTA